MPQLQGQTADRFSRAIDQLGQEGRDKLSIRLGAIYSLQRLMHDSPTDEGAVVEVLCAFIRTHAFVPEENAKVVAPATADVRATVVVLGNRPRPDDFGLDWSNSLLSIDRISLNGGNLNYAFLGEVSLVGASLLGASLVGADLDGADLTDVLLHGADLTGANLTLTHLRGADLTVAHMHGADLRGADLTGADLTGADLTGADLHYADLTGANLSGANLSGAQGLTSEQLEKTTTDDKTSIPNGLNRPSVTPAPSPS